MNPSLPERLTSQFYDWERRGRGWNFFDDTVDLEPEFVPFFFHLDSPKAVPDDARVPTFLSRIADLFRTPIPPIEVESFPEFPVEAYPFQTDEGIKTISVTLPKGYKVKREETEQLLFMLSNTEHPISFEIIGSQSRISLQFGCRESDVHLVGQQIKGYFPESTVTLNVDLFDEMLDQSAHCLISDFGLKYEFTRPLTMVQNFDPDSFIGLFAPLEFLQDGEYGVIQILFKGVINPWAESILRSVSDTKGGSFFIDAPDMLPLAKEKVSAPLYAVCMKVAGISQTDEAATRIGKSISEAFVRIYSSNANSLVFLSNPSYDFTQNSNDFLKRTSHRQGMLLNLKELATIVHFPSASVTTLKLDHTTKKTKLAPKIAIGHELILGINEHQGRETEVSLAPEVRLRHMHIVGATGTGKSTLLHNLIVEDIQNGEGVAVLDPHGDLIDSILEYIPEERMNDVLLIDPADAEFPVGFNILQAHSEIEKDILSSDLVAVFRRLSTSWGDQMNSVFANAILAILESKIGGTLVDLRRFLVEKSFREEYLKTVTDSNIVYYWQKEYPLLHSSSIGSILTRLDSFLRPKLIRNMVAQKKGIDFENLLDSKKIILVKLAQGLIGTENSYLLGTFVVSKIHQAAMARQGKAKEARSDFFLYIDEFQNFITPSMSSILSGARKYHLGLILAHQDMQQLIKQDSELAQSVLSNASTRVCFRVGETDAKRFAEGFSYFEASDLQNLTTGEAIVRIEKPEFDFNIRTVPFLEGEEPYDEHLKTDSILFHSRSKYATAKTTVENLLQETREETLDKNPVSDPINVLQQAIEAPLPLKEQPGQPFSKQKPLEEIKPRVELISEEKKQEVRQHRYLQNMIKRMAESKGFKALIEEATPDNKGRVDVSLERNDKKIAVEISITTDATWELHNIEKCLGAGYDTIIVCSPNKQTLQLLRQKISASFNPEEVKQILILQPEEVYDFLSKLVIQEISSERVIKGFRVTSEFDSVSEKDMEKKREAVSRSILNSIKKGKNKK